MQSINDIQTLFSDLFDFDNYNHEKFIDFQYILKWITDNFKQVFRQNWR